MNYSLSTEREYRAPAAALARLVSPDKRYLESGDAVSPVATSGE